MKEVYVYDTTLRDGTQGEGVSLSVEDKVKIAQRLDFLGVDYIEGGWPGSNPKDLEFFSRIREINLESAKITAFGSTRRPGKAVDEDANIQALLDSGVSVACLVGKSWDFHVREALSTTLEENLAMIGDSIRYLKDQGLEIHYDAEHFFDGFKHNPGYTLATIREAAAAGADWIILCDTNGGTMPHEIKEIVTRVVAEIKTPLGIHVHNDCDLAVANTITAVQAGVRQVQGTINGLGERCGNANLFSVIPNLQLKLKMACLPQEKLAHLTEVSRYVSEIANVSHPNNLPFVGHSAFAHKGGIHVSALLKDPGTYEHMNPELVGNIRRVLVSELSGTSNILYKAKELCLDIDLDKPEAGQIIEAIKDLEHQGFQFEGAEASLELLLLRAFCQRMEPFELETFKLMVEKRGDHRLVSEAVIKLKVGDKVIHTAAEGNGPVNALDNALRKALEDSYPGIREMHLTDYKVRVIDEKDATAAKVRVLIESRDPSDSWSTVGVSENIIEASWQALCDSICYTLYRREKAKK